MASSLVETLIAATLTALANGLGGLPFVFLREFPERVAHAGWAVAGGLMLSASVFNLIMPGVAEGGFTPVAVGIALGAALMVGASRWVNQEEFGLDWFARLGSRRGLLILLTLFIHSFPEGLALGVAFGSGKEQLGLIMAVAIAIHNIPEGVAVALPMRAEGLCGWRCVGWAVLSGLPQVLAAGPAYLAVTAFQPFLPYSFGFAAGAMIFLVLSEMIPESRADERQRLSSGVAGMLGFLGMMVLQQVLTF